ncbi:hypothetical protein HP1_003 [Candidatus Termititenax spirochaetophilus]|uniref:Uncharacterized protein n=1 Tax=Candidatus Termititenax spirochaetophilus TaxID=2218522 RepID=A0A388T6B0_9BACT|nr:hypothetical protein HP1_003 [Candidatus Termititenax spirochaetophilus]
MDPITTDALLPVTGGTSNTTAAKADIKILEKAGITDVQAFLRKIPAQIKAALKAYGWSDDAIATMFARKEPPASGYYFFADGFDETKIDIEQFQKFVKDQIIRYEDSQRNPIGSSGRLPEGFKKWQEFKNFNIVPKSVKTAELQTERIADTAKIPEQARKYLEPTADGGYKVREQYADYFVTELAKTSPKYNEYFPKINGKNYRVFNENKWTEFKNEFFSQQVQGQKSEWEISQTNFTNVSALNKPGEGTSAIRSDNTSAEAGLVKYNKFIGQMNDLNLEYQVLSLSVKQPADAEQLNTKINGMAADIYKEYSFADAQNMLKIIDADADKQKDLPEVLNLYLMTLGKPQETLNIDNIDIYLKKTYEIEDAKLKSIPKEQSDFYKMQLNANMYEMQLELYGNLFSAVTTVENLGYYAEACANYKEDLPELKAEVEKMDVAFFAQPNIQNDDPAQNKQKYLKDIQDRIDSLDKELNTAIPNIRTQLAAAQQQAGAANKPADNGTVGTTPAGQATTGTTETSPARQVTTETAPSSDTVSLQTTKGVVDMKVTDFGKEVTFRRGEGRNIYLDEVPYKTTLENPTQKDGYSYFTIYTLNATGMGTVDQLTIINDPKTKTTRYFFSDTVIY